MFESGVWLFATAYLLSVASPGPGIAALVSRTLARGWHGTPSFILGFVAGDLLWFTAAVTGVSALAQRGSGALVVMKYAGAAYLVYLAYRMWTSNVDLPDDDSRVPQRDQLFVASFLLTLGNPKPMMFFLAVLPTVVDLERLSLTGALTLAVVMTVVLVLVMGTYVLAALRARGFFTNHRALRMLNRCGALVMTGAAVIVVRG